MPKTEPSVLAEIIKGFKTVLDIPDVSEGTVQDYMEQHSEIVPLPSLLGHDLHMGCVISKFELDRCRVPDLAYLTKNTAYWRLVAIELERPEKTIFTQAERGESSRLRPTRQSHKSRIGSYMSLNTSRIFAAGWHRCCARTIFATMLLK